MGTVYKWTLLFVRAIAFSSYIAGPSQIHVVAIVIVDSCYNSQGLVKQVWSMVEIHY